MSVEREASRAGANTPVMWVKERGRAVSAGATEVLVVTPMPTRGGERAEANTTAPTPAQRAQSRPRVKWSRTAIVHVGFSDGHRQTAQ